MQQSEGFDYTGTDNLEVTAQAVRYNAFLHGLATRYLPRERRCLDFGAGIGTFAKKMAEDGYQVEALDVDRHHCDLMKAAGLVAYESLDEIEDKRFNTVYTMNVLEHIEDDVQSLRDLNRVMEPGGTLLIYVPAFQWLFTSMDRKVGHVRRYTRPELVRKVREAGFRVERAQYADSLGVLATLVYKLMGSSDGGINIKSLVLYDRVFFPISRLLDKVLVSHIVGKNVWLVANKP